MSTAAGSHFPVQPNIRKPCEHCHDLGITRAIANTGERFETLIRCDCREGKANTSKLPIWQYATHAREFQRQPCPSAWFLPDGGSHKLDYWKAKLQIAEMYWQHQNQPVPKKAAPKPIEPKPEQTDWVDLFGAG